MNELLAYLVTARKSMGLTQEDVAHHMGTTQSHVSAFERGEIDPHVSTVMRYARAVGAKIEFEVCVTQTSEKEESA